MNQKPDPDKLARVLAESAHQFWSAGLGALSLAEKESSRFFETLSKLSENIQSHTGKTADRALRTVAGGRNTASETWEKLEEMFELRVARVLNGLQIPTARDIKELTKRVDKLSKNVDEMKAIKSAAKKPAASKKKGKKTTKKSASKKKKQKEASEPRKSKPRKKRAGS